MDKFIILGILILLGLVFLYLMFNTPKRKKYNLKRLTFNNENNFSCKTLGNELFIAKSSRKFILPTEFDLWTEIILFENGIAFKRNNKEKKVYFSEIYEIEPMLINSLFVKGKYFGYIFKCNDNSIIVKSNDIEDLELFMEKLFDLFPKEMIREI
ncbi:hypothetical protein VJI77_02580 [Parvimonas sp. D2]|uniref:hypothetical protein n=1 Tax=unclassified Parvimonas TaxID=1151464 RepID=UPI002B47E0D8|nr:MULTISPECIES: hypothetical protein [unclassified Parvimonas]MEB3011890.1 hypothetical protein [Parvimonas sp. D2]MEB3087678.1 hypothetical protein [Parvimonas sp. D4]